MNVTLTVLGIALLAAAVVGGSLKAGGVEVPLVASGGRQLLLAAVGVGALVAAFVAPQRDVGSQTSSHATTAPAVTTETPQGRVSPTLAPSKRPGTTLFSKNQVHLNYGYALSFNDPDLRPIGVGGVGSGDLYIGGMENYVQSSAQLAVYDGQAGFAECPDDTNWVSIVNPGSSPPPLVGKTLCITTAHRIAACHVTTDTTSDFSGTPDHGLTMDVVVYGWH